MFTVKVVYWDGSENIWQTRNVATRAQERETSNMPLVMQSVWFQSEDGSELEISGGNAYVYVMNENGKTVANYHLGGDEVGAISSEVYAETGESV